MSIAEDFTLKNPFLELVDGVRSVLASAALDSATGLRSAPTVERGWKARSVQINQGPGRANRVIFSGSMPNGAAGRMVQPRQVGERVLYGLPDEDDIRTPVGTMRALCDWQRTLYVSIWAYDGDNATDEGAQDDAVHTLFLWVIRAVNAVAFGNASWGSVAISVPLERGFGLEILSDLTFQFQMPDQISELAFPGPVVVPPTGD